MPTTPIHPNGSYKVYIAHLHQNSSNPPILNYEYNQFNNPVTWTRSATGLYIGTCPEEFINRDKIICFTGQGLGPNWTITLYPQNDSELVLQVSYGTATDDWQNVYIEIRKYN